jgi:hypothetical protein
VSQVAGGGINPSGESSQRVSDDADVDSHHPAVRVVNRLITLLSWILIPPVLVGTLGGACLFTYAVVTEGPGGGSSGLLQSLAAVGPGIAELAKGLWSVLAPVITIVVLTFLWRAIRHRTSGQLDFVRDVPALIAVAVIITVCMLPVLRLVIPEPLANIALVIVGFYFGNQDRKRTADLLEQSIARGGGSASSYGSGPQRESARD